eukprot:TCALIF_08954-PA protein Name:"Protein of unknown function" AED:0.84 eAED:1.00 QI:0/0/0/0.5/1/1/2/0/106
MYRCTQPLVIVTSRNFKAPCRGPRSRRAYKLELGGREGTQELLDRRRFFRKEYVDQVFGGSGANGDVFVRRTRSIFRPGPSLARGYSGLRSVCAALILPFLTLCSF